MKETPRSTANSPSWKEFDRALAEAGFRPSRRLGQNFLHDRNALEAIVRAAEIERGSRVLEVGTGVGVLTYELASRGADVLAVEIDARLAAITRRFMAPFSRFRLIERDVLASKHRLADELLEALSTWRDWSLVANLPYSVASPLMALVARLEHPPSRMVVTIQQEVALRVLAQPGGRDWGPLSVRLALAYRGEYLHRLPPECFLPRPEIDSAVVRLSLRENRATALELEAADELIDVLFQQRRKAIAGLLRGYFIDRATADLWLARHGVDGKARPETLAAETFLDLVRDPIWRDRPNR